MDPNQMLADLLRGASGSRTTPHMPVPPILGALTGMMGAGGRANAQAVGQAPEMGQAPTEQYQTGEEEAESAAPTAGESGSDEEMLETVRQGMGGGGEGGAQGGAAPPPGSGMKWMSIEEDTAALIADPSSENIQAFVDYWGADQLPPELQQTQPEEGTPYDVAANEEVKPLPMVNTGNAAKGSITDKGLKRYDMELGRQPGGQFGINEYKKRG